jgi:adenylate cyclase
VGGQLGMALGLRQHAEEEGEPVAGDVTALQPTLPGEPPSAVADREPLVIRHYTENDSVFLNGDYLIKGVAGSIFRVLVLDYTEKGRCHFSNRELRLDARIRLPDISDNLEARLILLSRRLVERNAPLRIEKTGRGRFQLRVDGPLRLVEVRDEP